MSNWKATKATLRWRLKNLLGSWYRKLIDESWTWSSDEYNEYQNQQFAKIYSIARECVPYYRDRPDEYPPFDPARDQVREFLRKLPIITKSIVRDNNSQFWRVPRPLFSQYHTTSGTTGTPLKLCATTYEKAFSEATLGSWYQKIAGTRWPRAMFLTGFMTPSAASSELYWIDRLTGCSYLSIYSLNDRNRHAVVDLIRRTRPQLIYGYASAVRELARCVGDSVYDTKGQRVAVTTSEVLYPQWRDEIEAHFARRVYDLYGSQEACHEVVELDDGRHYISPLIGIVELLDEAQNQAEEGELGHVVVTSLNRIVMPLIRYAIGDTAESTGFATVRGSICSWPTMGPVSGRSEDMVRTRDGRRIGYLNFHSTKDLEGIQESQFVQTSFESFICRIVAKPSINRLAVERAIRDQLIKRIQADVDVQFEYLDKIPRGAEGKFKAVVVDFEEATS